MPALPLGALPRYVDPPQGWRYGFPKVWRPTEQPDLRQWFLDGGYPEKDIDLAMSYSRYWKAEDE